MGKVKIRIVEVPNGTTPIEVRKQWIGVQLEVEEWQVNGIVKYKIKLENAINALESSGKSTAATFWKSRHAQYLFFKEEVCEVV